MMRLVIVAIGAWALVSRPGLLAAREVDRPLAFRDRTCLFLDEHFVAEQAGLRRT